MDFETYVSWISNPVQIAFIDLILGADNAVIIALVCSTLPRRFRMNVLIVGTGAAMLLRLFLTAVAGVLMSAPLIRLLGGLVLMLIAISLVDGFGEAEAKSGDDGAPEDFADAQAATEAFWDAILLVALADGVMSLDNTVALAAVAKGDILYLVLGLALSVPMLVFGSWLLTELFGTTPWFVRAAMAVLGWVAGDMAVSDPLIASWIRTEAPALAYAVPLAAVVFVLAEGAIYRRRLLREQSLLPITVSAGGGDADAQPSLADWSAEEARPAGPVEPRAALSTPAGAAGVRRDASPGLPLPAVVAVAAPAGAHEPAEAGGPPVHAVDAAAAGRGTASDLDRPAPTMEEPAVIEGEVLAPVDATEPEPAVPPMTAAAMSTAAAEPLVAAEPAEQKRARDEKMMVIGLIALLVVAACMISAAIVVGGATF